MWNYYRDKPSDPLSSNSESFKYKASITGNTYDGDDNIDRVAKNETEVVIPLKHLSNFWRTLNITLINWEIELILTWFKNCALVDMTVRAAGNNNDPPVIVAPTGLEFQRILNYLFDPTFTKFSRLYVLSFERINENGAKKGYSDSFSHYYVSNIEIKDLNILIDGKSFFDLPVENEEEAYEKIIELKKKNEYTTGN